ncbi:MAG: hypothetical protein AAGF12_26575 [Myxococcota bacterium]
MTLLIVLRFLKLLAVLAFAAGSVGSVMARDFEDRKRFAHWVAGPGWGLTWIMGFLLVYLQELSFLSLWILAAMAVSMVGINGVMYVAGKEHRRGPGPAMVVIGCLAVTVALMVWRPIL